MIIQRQGGSEPSWLAPRVAFDVVIERIAEQSLLLQERVWLGVGWYWDRSTNALLRPPGWAAVEGAHLMPQQSGGFELSVADRLALSFARLPMW